MRVLRVCLLRMLWVLLLSGFIATATAKDKKPPTSAAQISVEDFVQQPGVKDVQISPDGKHLALVYKQSGEYLLLILDAKTRQSVGAYQVKGDNKAVGKIYWVNNERLVYSVVASRSWNKEVYENGELFAVNIDGKLHNVIFGRNSGQNLPGSGVRKISGEYGYNTILDLLADDDKHILLAFYPWRVRGRSLRVSRIAKPIIYKLNVYNGKKSRQGYLPVPLADAIVDNNGQVRFSTAVNDDDKQVIWYKDQPEDDWQKWTLKGFSGNRVTPLSFTADNRQVYLLGDVGNGTRALHLFNLKDKSIKKVVHDEQVDVSSLIYDFDGRQIVAVGTELALPLYRYIDSKDDKARLHQTMLKKFAGFNVKLISASKDGETVVVFVHSDKHPGSYLLYSKKTQQMAFIIARRQWIDLELMAPTESLTFNTRDDATIYGYLTKPLTKDLPAKTAKKALPLVVLPHGGPHGVRDYWRFDWRVQLLASRGYAVLQLNYRGSGGFGYDYENIGKRKWGTLMQDDLTDATQAMISQGIADPKRICLFGASYGGYAALMGAVREPDLYQCVIGSAGVYSLPMMFEEGDIQKRDNGLVYLKEVLGEDQADLKRRSPAYNVDKIKAKVLLIHGAQDERAPMAQVEFLMAAFDKIGKKYQWLEIEDEAHGYDDEQNRLKVYDEVLAFLQAHIGQ
ncbi:MAG: dipeptidyl aminopeptidase/acylaminoacyl peptidase [Phenylobacterium sp.]|jgi:dipeptidyl aminopeptidase/acylaminoacyl peptidase